MTMNQQMMAQPRLIPGTAGELAEMVRDAHARHRSLEINGGGTKRAVGGPVEAVARLDVSALQGVEFYEPEELVVKVAAATPVAELEQLLATRGQWLGFEPPDFAECLGVPNGKATVGGIFACNIAGPRRLLAGAPRDITLGVEAVNGKGDMFKAGGRTVKNVAGFDLVKLLSGSYGSLAVVTALTFKVLPKPKAEMTLVLTGVEPQRAVKLLAPAVNLPLAISGAAHHTAGNGLTLLRVDGLAESVKDRIKMLRERLPETAAAKLATNEESSVLWQTVRDLTLLACGPEDCLWRVMAPAAHMAGLVSPLGGEALYDWAGSRCFVKIPAVEVPHQAARLRDAVLTVGGNACLFRAPDVLRRQIGAFQPKAPALAHLIGRIRDSFDPKRIFNPGKL
jgi:glycolate oxidase FAD binding subunit